MNSNKKDKRLQPTSNGTSSTRTAAEWTDNEEEMEGTQVGAMDSTITGNSLLLPSPSEASRLEGSTFRKPSPNGEVSCIERSPPRKPSPSEASCNDGRPSTTLTVNCRMGAGASPTTPKGSKEGKEKQTTIMENRLVLGKSPGAYLPGTSWEMWKRRFENYLTLRRVTDPKERKCAFLDEVGLTAHETLCKLMQFSGVDRASLEELYAQMEKRFQPRPLVMAERFRMLQLQQKHGQSLDDFYTEVQAAAETCQFDKIEDFRDTMVTMVYVGGMTSTTTRQKLLEDRETCKTAMDTHEKAKAYETLCRDAGHLKDGRGSVGIGAVKNYKKAPHGATKRHPKVPHQTKEREHKRECWTCGRAGHSKMQCRVRNPECTHCRRKGHLEAACRAKKSHNKVNHCDETDSEYDSDDGYYVNAVRKENIKKKPWYKRETAEQGPQGRNVNKRTTNGSEVKKRKPVHRVKSEPPRLLSIQLNNKEVKMELDTGASISLINEETWKSLERPELVPEGITATGCNQKRIPLKGKCMVRLHFMDKTAEQEVYVMKGKGQNLCGRDMISALEIDCGPHYRMVKRVQDKEVNRQEITRILSENAELFTTGLGRCTLTKATLVFREETPEPKFYRPRPVPFALRPKVEEKLDEMINQGMVKPVEHSDWATPLVVVPKPGGKIRICGDYKVTVNPQLDINQYPLPVPDELFHLLNGGQKFSKMDLRDAYMQIELDEKSRKYTTINTHKGLYEYTRIPFGVASAPAIFQRIMETTLSGLEGVFVYLDDITVTGPDDKTHLERVEKILQRLNTAGFKLKREKCSFLKEEIEFLGHVVNKEGIKPSPEKVKAIENMPVPKNVKEIESFIGMVQYYGKFIPGLSSVAAPINGLRKKDVKFEWKQEQQKAFLEIKRRLTETKCLAHYDPKIPVVLATDASDYGLGAVLYHKHEDGTEKVIAYASRTLTKHEKNYAQIEKEALGIVVGVEKFNQFLYGRKFTLLTDHQPLVTIFGPKHGLPVIAAKRVHRWALRLMCYSFDIEYRNTTVFGHADGLSRLPDPRELPSGKLVKEEAKVLALFDEKIKEAPFNEKEIRQATQKDKLLMKVANHIKNGWRAKENDKEMKIFAAKKAELSIHKGLILWDTRVVIPDVFQKRALEMLHNSHFGKTRMTQLARETIWFPRIDQKIKEVAESCETCAVMGNDPKRSVLRPWPEPEKPWQRIHMDLAENDDKSRWLVIVDAKSKWPEVIEMTSTTSRKVIETLKKTFAVHGLPEEIVSDNGPQFASQEFREYCESRNIEWTPTPPYHPNSNGEAERMVQTFKRGLKKGIKSGKSRTQAALDVLFQYRVTEHPATGKSPAEMLMGRKLRTVLNVIKTEKKTVELNPYREQMAKNHAGKARERQYNVGQEVYLRNYRSSGDKWLSGVILERKGNNLYVVHYGNGNRLAHVDQIKPRVLLWEDVPTWEPVRKDNLQTEEQKELRRSTRSRTQPQWFVAGEEKGKRNKPSIGRQQTKNAKPPRSVKSVHVKHEQMGYRWNSPRAECVDSSKFIDRGGVVGLTHNLGSYRRPRDPACPRVHAGRTSKKKYTFSCI